MTPDPETAPSPEPETRSHHALFVIFGALVVVVIGLALLVLDSFDDRPLPGSETRVQQEQSAPPPTTAPAPPTQPQSNP